MLKAKAVTSLERISKASLPRMYALGDSLCDVYSLPFLLRKAIPLKIVTSL